MCSPGVTEFHSRQMDLRESSIICSHRCDKAHSCETSENNYKKNYKKSSQRNQNHISHSFVVSLILHLTVMSVLRSY